MTERPETAADDAVAATDDRHDSDAAGLRSPRPAAESRKPKEIRSVSELLTYAYSRTGRSFSITPAAKKALADDTTEFMVLADQITRLATSDPLLAVPPRVLAAMERAMLRGRPRKTLLRLTAVPILRHPGLASVDLAPALADEPTPDHESLFRSMREALNHLELEHLGKASPRSTARRTLTNNAVLSVALLIAIKDDWPTAVLADCLNSYLWQDELSATKVRSERALIADGMSPATLGLVARAWYRRLSEQALQVRQAEAEAHDARRAQQQAISHAATMADAMEQIEKKIAQREEVVASLGNELASEREHRRIDRSHAIDDYERLRTKLIRDLVQQTSLLENGLHALRNSRIQVIEEYVERVIESLHDDLQHLRNGGKQDGSE